MPGGVANIAHSLKRVELTGCRTQPLAHYLKALAVLRLLSEQTEAPVRGFWAGDVFIIESPYDEGALVDFFLNEYVPTPLLSPWNGASGFWTNDAAARALEQMRNATSNRLQPYVRSIQKADAIIQELGIDSKPNKAQKAMLMRHLRARMPDSFVTWMDALCALNDDDTRYAAVLGTGANDGRLDFTANFIQRLLLLGFNGASTSNQRRDPTELLEFALFERGRPRLDRSAIGQLHPGGIGGPNSTQGFSDESLNNPWDYVLMMEGTLVLSGSVAKRLGSEARQAGSFPFAVELTAAGIGSIASEDQDSARQEVWFPLWERPTRYKEVSYLFYEGRAQIGRRFARNGTDFARALATLGTNRGLVGFVRFGFFQRNGKAYVAAPLGHFGTRVQPGAQLLNDLDPWLVEVRRAVRTAPESLKRDLRRVEEAIMALTQAGETAGLQTRARIMQNILIAAGRANHNIGRSPALRASIRPLQSLSQEWVEVCDDGSAEFSIAKALASISEEDVGPIRVQCESVAVQGRSIVWRDSSTGVVWTRANLRRNLERILERRTMEAAPGEGCMDPYLASCEANLTAVHQFLLGITDDQRISQLLLGLMTVRFTREGLRVRHGVEPKSNCLMTISRSYLLFKELFRPHYPGNSLGADQLNGRKIKDNLRIIRKLIAGDFDSAVLTACRRLRYSGLNTLTARRQGGALAFGEPKLVRQRMAAALLIPATVSRVLQERVFAVNDSGDCLDS